MQLELLGRNPTKGIPFLPVERRIREIPPLEDVEKALAVADPDVWDYLLVICDTLARVSEVNRLTWADVDLENRNVRGGHLTPRRIPMTQRLFELLSRRYSEREKSRPWVFWVIGTDWKTGKTSEGPYRRYRRTILKTLCKKAGVRPFTFHALRHLGASIMDSNHVPMGSIQKILGHENRTTTEIYLHSLGDAEKSAIDVFEQAVTKKVSHESHTDFQTKEKEVRPDLH